MKKSSYTPADINDGFVVSVTIEAKEGEAEAVAALIAGLVAPTLAEPGVKLFIPYRSPANPLLFFIYELYVCEEIDGAHHLAGWLHDSRQRTRAARCPARTHSVRALCRDLDASPPPPPPLN